MTYIIDSIIFIYKIVCTKNTNHYTRRYFYVKIKKLKKYVALGLSCLIAINTTTVTFAQNSTSTQKYESANTEVSNKDRKSVV